MIRGRRRRRRPPRDCRDVRHSPLEIAGEALVLTGVFVLVLYGAPLALCVADLRYCR